MENIWAPRILSRLFPAGLVESYSLRLHDPASKRAAWIQYSFTKPFPVEGALGECWAVVFQPDSHTPAGSKQTSELAACHVTADLTEIRIGTSLLAPGIASGSVGSGISWRLAFSPTPDPARLLPDPLYGDGVPLSRLSTPFARVKASGELRFHDTCWTLDQWPMSISHNWGQRHTDRCAWGQIRGDSPFGETYFEGLTLPLPIPGHSDLTAATLLVGGRSLSFSKPRSWWSNKGSYRDGSWLFRTVNSSHVLDGSISWDPAQVATLRYVQPNGTVRWCRSSLLASGSLKLRPRFPGSSDLAFDLEAKGNAVLEILDPELPPATPILA